MDNGWIKLSRGLKEWRWYKDAETLLVFINLLLSANHKDNEVGTITIKRGQLMTSVKSICEDTGLTTQVVRTRLDRLELTGEITQKTTNKFRVITICNYDSYQNVQEGTQQSNNNQITINQQSNNKQLTTNKNDKNIRNKEYISKEKKEEKKESGAETSSAPPLQKNKSNVFIPPEIDEVKKYCEERGNGIDPNSFIDFYASKGWMIGKNKMKDWRAAVRTWERRNNQTSRDGNGNRYKSARDREIEDRLTRGAIVYDPSQPKIPNKL